MWLKSSLPYVTRLFVGLTFVLSAILKFISVDSFELYIYGFDVLSLWMASLLSRGVLFVEMCLGIALIANVYRRWINILVAGLLCAFTLFLIALVMAGTDGNCHCMGDAFELSPAKSIVKNILLLSLLYYSAKKNSPQIFATRRRQLIAMSVIALGSLIFAFAKLPYGLAKKKETLYNAEKFREWVKTQQIEEELHQHHSVIAFFSTSCRHCRMAMSKMEVCRKKYPDTPVRWVVWGSDSTLNAFLSDTKIEEQKHTFLDPKDMMPITEFNIPLLLFLEKDSVLKCMSNASFDESEVLDFLAK